MRNKVISVFPNADLRSGHNGLRKLALKNKQSIDLDPGEFHLYINRAQTAFKMFAANHVLVHYKSPRGMIDIRTIQYLPYCFNAGELDYDKALSVVLHKFLKKKVDE